MSQRVGLFALCDYKVSVYVPRVHAILTAMMFIDRCGNVYSQYLYGVKKKYTKLEMGVEGTPNVPRVSHYFPFVPKYPHKIV